MTLDKQCRPSLLLGCSRDSGVSSWSAPGAVMAGSKARVVRFLGKQQLGTLRGRTHFRLDILMKSPSPPPRRYTRTHTLSTLHIAASCKPQWRGGDSCRHHLRNYKMLPPYYNLRGQGIIMIISWVIVPAFILHSALVSSLFFRAVMQELHVTKACM